MTDSEFVQMLVPARFEKACQAYVASLLKAESESPVVTPDPEASGAETFEWTRGEVAEVASTMPWDELLLFLDHLSAHPLQWEQKRAFELAEGFGRMRLEGQLSALNPMYLTPMGKSHWFFEWQHNEDDGLFYYRMSTDVAAWWRAARGLDIE